jgi:hypothetical protein
MQMISESQPANIKSQLANTKVSRQLTGQKGYVNKSGEACTTSMKQDPVSNDPETFSCHMCTYALVCGSVGDPRIGSR